MHNTIYSNDNPIKDQFHCANWLNILTSGSIIVLMATPRPAIDTKRAVIFSIRVFILFVSELADPKSFILICLNIFIKKAKISQNLDTKYKEQQSMPIQDSMAKITSLISWKL